MTEEPEYEIVTWPSHDRRVPRFDWLWPMLLGFAMASLWVGVRAPNGSDVTVAGVIGYVAFLVATLVRINIWLSRLLRQRYGPYDE